MTTRYGSLRSYLHQLIFFCILLSLWVGCGTEQQKEKSPVTDPATPASQPSPTAGVKQIKESPPYKQLEEQRQRKVVELSAILEAKARRKLEHKGWLNDNPTVQKAFAAYAGVTEREMAWRMELALSKPEGKPLAERRRKLLSQIKTYNTQWTDFDYKTKGTSSGQRNKQEQKLREELAHIEKRLKALSTVRATNPNYQAFSAERRARLVDYNRIADQAVAAVDPQMAELVKREVTLQTELEELAVIQRKVAESEY